MWESRHAAPAAPGGRRCTRRFALLVRVGAVPKGARWTQKSPRRPRINHISDARQSLDRPCMRCAVLGKDGACATTRTQPHGVKSSVAVFFHRLAAQRNSFCKLGFSPKIRVTGARIETKGYIDSSWRLVFRSERLKSYLERCARQSSRKLDKLTRRGS